MDEVHNDLSGTVHGHVVQANRIDQVSLPAQPPDALAGLPPDSAEFVGRGAELTELLNVLSPQVPGRPVLVTAVAGLAGVGKTTLALRAAHQACANGWFPGGALFLNLRGYDPTGAVDESSALAAFLHALGVPGEHVPPGLPARQALYRSRLAAHAAARGSVLVVLDNAYSADQVRPLLPGDPRNRSLITSRHTLADLTGTRQLDLDVLDPDEAVALISSVLRAAWPRDTRTSGDPAGTAELAELCGHLPLALSIVAAILVDDRDQSIGELVEELRETSTRLGGLSFGDTLAVRAAFDLSYARLTDDERCLFRLLSLCPGPRVSIAAAAAVLGTSAKRARRLLGSLRRAHVTLSAGMSGWFRLHDLLRLYASECAAAEDGQPLRDEAVDRLLDYYLETATAAENQLRPDRFRSAALLRFTDRRTAFEWLDAERPCLAGAVRLAAETGRHTVARDLAFVLSPYFDLRKHWDEWSLTLHAALAATRELEDRAGESKAHHSLGNLARQRRFLDTATQHYEQAWKIRRELGDRNGEALTLNTLAIVHQHRNRSELALEYATKALKIQHEIGNAYGQALTLNTIGSIKRSAGDLPAALKYDGESRQLHAKRGDSRGMAQAENNLGSDYRLLGQPDKAVRACERAAKLHREVGDRYGEAQTLFNLGLALLATGIDQARVQECWEASRAAFAECGDGWEADKVRAQLAVLAAERSAAADSTVSPSRPVFYYDSFPGQQGNM